MRMVWSELLFAHWPVDAARVRDALPHGLELDLFDGEAWLGVVPFVMSGVRLRWLPPLPTASRFCELNVRTYVVDGGKPGVWFFSLDAASELAVLGGRRLFHLPYFDARMSCEVAGRVVSDASARTDRRGPAANFRASYEPTSSAREARAGSLEHWLVERYCLYASDGARLLRGEIDHPPWRLHDARAQIELETMASAAGFELPSSPPLLHFAGAQDVVAWTPERAS
jgi:uncharacterized protein YqjF (DUF2071 family)